MKLKKLLETINYTLIKGSLEIEINDLSYDSRNITPKTAFVAMTGIDTDGHYYIKDAIKQGCNCIIICKDIQITEDITVVKITDTRKELSILSANLFEHPAKDLIKIAITGTKGKTSTSWMIKNILEKAGHQVGVIGTIGTYINGRLYQHKNTTPESYQIQKFMRKMVNCGTKYLIMEASSQALKVGRINNIIFEYGIFTNLSTDHIGPREHSSYEDYANSKAKLFQQSKIGIINHDDQEYSKMEQNATCQIYSYGTDTHNDLVIKNIFSINQENFLGIEFTNTGLANETFKVSAPGTFSAYNASAAILLCKLLKINPQAIKEGLTTFHVEGRCEIIPIQNKFKVVIDFAHNQISMESILKTMKSYHPNQIITIFGCGGGRSPERRYELGVTSGTYADLSIITTDNPRNDNIDEINQDIVKGLQTTNGKYLIIKEREEAIKYALHHANQNDIILLLGKGHENYQEIKGIKYPFNEKEIINNFINS